MATTAQRPRRDTEDVVGAIRRQIRALEARACDEDPWAAAEMLDLSRELEEAAVRVVGNLRGRGYTWADIGYSIDGGISKVTAYKRYAHRIEESEQHEDSHDLDSRRAGVCPPERVAEGARSTRRPLHRVHLPLVAEAEVRA